MGKEHSSTLQRKRAMNRWSRIRRKQAQSVALAKQQLEYERWRSKFLGYLAGDGSLIQTTNASGNPRITVGMYPDDIGMLEEVQRLSMRLFNKKFRVQERKNYWDLRFDSIVVGHDLLSEGDHGTFDWTIPNWILENREFAALWISGFFDSEGYVSDSVVQMQSVNKDGMQKLHEALAFLGISSTLTVYERKNPRHATNYILSITGSYDLLRFALSIESSHRRKKHALNAFL